MLMLHTSHLYRFTLAIHLQKISPPISYNLLYHHNLTTNEGWGHNEGKKLVCGGGA